MCNSLFLRFIRTRASSKTDDTVNIKRLGPDQYSLAYTYGEAVSKKAMTATLSSDDTFRWLRHTLGLLEVDNDPFESVQMDFPLMPSVLVKITGINDAYDRLLNAVEFHLDNWPVAPAPAYISLNPEENSEEEEEEEDMPPLIPMHDNNTIRNTNNINNHAYNLRSHHIFA